MNPTPFQWLSLGVLVIAGLVHGSQAHASTYPNARGAAGQAVWNAAMGGRSTTVGGGGAVAGGLVSRAPTAGTAGAAKVGADGPLKVGDKTVPVGFTGEVAKDAIVGGVVGCLSGGALGCALGVATPLALAYVANSGVRRNPETGNLEMQEKYFCGIGPCWEYTGTYATPTYYGPAAICQVIMSGQNSADTQYWWSNPRFDGTGMTAFEVCRFDVHWRSTGLPNGNDGISLTARPRPASESPTWNPVTPQEVKDELYKNDPPPGIVDELAKYGNINWPMGNGTLSGPSSVAGPKEVTQHPDGSSTERSTQTDYSYSGPKVTEGASRTTTTKKDPQGNVTSEETTTTTPPDQEEAPNPDESPTDTPLPEIPNLYSPKFPQGMTGVWETRKAELMNSPLMQLKDQLLPTVGDGGACPSWQLPVNVAWVDFGTYNVAPPCWIWDFGKVVIVLSAMFLARALIFGG